MKKDNGHKIKLGVFVSMGVTVFIIGIYFIGKRQQLFGSTFHITAVFKDINGLKVGNNILFSGINVGIVDAIEQITDTSVSVGMLVDENSRLFIKKNAMATVGSEGLMGNKVLIITHGTSDQKAIVDNDSIKTSQPVSIDDILIKLKLTSNNAALITSDLALIMNNIRSGKGTIGMLISDTVFAGNVDEALVNIKQGAGGFKQNMNAAQHNILLRSFFKKKSKK
jgi:phospholipid/cholesterol/gamma-HCH transport system substrate-binding protein